jgi:hypothetical protein
VLIIYNSGQAAVAAAIEVLGTYLPDPTAGNIILRCSTKDRKGDWVWADILPNSWTTVISVNGPEVGVFERFPKVSEHESDRGCVALVIGKSENGHFGIEWSYVNFNKSEALIERPKNFSVCQPFSLFMLH